MLTTGAKWSAADPGRGPLEARKCQGEQIRTVSAPAQIVRRSLLIAYDLCRCDTEVAPADLGWSRFGDAPK